MKLKLDSEGQSRQTQVARLVDEDTDWRRRLAREFDVRSYLFDSRLESVDGLQDFPADGFASSLAGGLNGLSERFDGRPVPVFFFSRMDI